MSVKRITILVLFSGCALLLGLWLSSGDKQHGDSFLNSAALLVAVATMSQIIFAVFTYIEGTMLKQQIETIKEHHSREQELSVCHLMELRESFYEVSKSTVKSLMESISSMPPPQYGAAIQRLQLAQIKIELAHSSYKSLSSAVQLTFKLDRERFLDIQEVIWDKSAKLEQKDKEKIRKEYSKLKTEAIKILKKN